MLQRGTKPMGKQLLKYIEKQLCRKLNTMFAQQAADAEREKYQADLDQQHADQAYAEIEKLVEKLQKDHRRAINKSQ